MNKNYIIGLIVGFVLIVGFAGFLNYSDKKSAEKIKSSIPRIGQKLWTYNMNGHVWRDYNENDNDASKEEIILQVQEPVGNGGYTSYHLLTGNSQVPKEDVWIGEGSQEFLIGKTLYSYYPKSFEFYEIVFNGVKFVPRKLSEKEIKTILNNYQIIRVSTLHKGTYSVKYSKNNNKFVILNDVGEDFYKYYIVPNESKKMEIDKFSNSFKVYDKVDIKIQRLEGCSKAYPCYEIKIN
ncbi:hypothetical protein HDR58_01190 [bacterium]|nr:hypothetical protein [bacterium]